MDNRPQRAAVIGANGFLGSALQTALARHRVPTALFSRARPFLGPGGRLDQDLQDADTIFWLASSIRPATAESGVSSANADHAAIGTLLDRIEATDHRGRCRVVMTSSGGTVYDSRNPPPHWESAPTVAANAYGEAMLELENELRKRTVDGVVLRVSNAYGPGQQARRGQGVIAYWLDAIASGRPIDLIGPPELARDYVYIDDVSAALLAVHEADAAPPVLNVGSGHSTTLGELLDLVRHTVDPLEVDVNYLPSRSFDAPSTWLDVGLADQELGWRPRVSLKAGLSMAWASILQSRVPTSTA